MTALDDIDFELDRGLAELFADGPSGAPERTIVFALDHAAAHPRRRDVLQAIRRDPMRSPAFGGSMRVLPLVAAIGLLAILALGAAFVGGAFNRTPVVVPPVVSPIPTTAPTPTASPTPSPSATPTATPSPTPAPTAIPSFASIHVDLIEHQGQDASIDIVDRSGDLASAVSGDPGDGGSVEDGKIEIVADPSDPKTLVLTWTGMPCDTTHTLDIAPDHTMTITRPACGGDAIPADHVLRLTFATPIDPASISGTVVTAGG
jgi:hypothetical protein